jgi:hypothetical protein
MSLGRHAFQTCICSLIVVNSFFVLYLMCCFGNNPLYMDFRPIKNLFCSVLTKKTWLHWAINVSETTNLIMNSNSAWKTRSVLSASGYKLHQCVSSQSRWFIYLMIFSIKLKSWSDSPICFNVDDALTEDSK